MKKCMYSLLIICISGASLGAMDKTNLCNKMQMLTLGAQPPAPSFDEISLKIIKNKISALKKWKIKNVNFNIRGKAGITPLMVAARCDFAECMEIMINAGADIEAKDSYGKTPLMHAVCANSVACTALLIKRGAALDACDILNMTPLHWAIDYKWNHIAKILLEHARERDCIKKIICAENFRNENSIELAKKKNEFYDDTLSSLIKQLETLEKIYS